MGILSSEGPKIQWSSEFQGGPVTFHLQWSSGPVDYDYYSICIPEI